jgi:glycine/D-amino acid oxidase-like deaminating enzyme/nitrite reductase/ring-hydroxylating ferredoxin subunit
MNTTSHWIDSSSLPSFPAPDRNIEVDSIVVGGGITGITTALLLKRAGRTVALIERGRCARIDTGHTTAHLTAVTDLRLQELIELFGKDAARSVWNAGTAAINQIATLVREENIDCGFERVPGFLHAPAGENGYAGYGAIEELKQEFEAALHLGISAEYLDVVPFMGAPGIKFPGQARFHPLNYLSALLPKIPGDGSYVFENTEAGEITDDPISVSAGGFKIRGRRIVLATHTPLQGTAGTMRALLFQTKLALYTSYAIGGRVPHGVVPDALYWDTRDPYNYLRIEQHRDFSYAIFGGEDHKTGQKHDTAASFDRLEERFRRIVPQIEIEHRWSGQVIETNDGLPFIGETAPHQFTGTGFAGNGMTFGTLTAMMAVDADAGRDNPWKPLFDVHRRKWRGGTWTYLKENKDYPYHLVRDWLSRGETDPLENLPLCSGKLLRIEGKKVAASRDAEGRFTLCSPVCPHLGCIVDWNDAEQTWDCPCHGSRFKPTGEVISGPAESPLEQIAVTGPDADSARRAAAQHS